MYDMGMAKDDEKRKNYWDEEEEDLPTRKPGAPAGVGNSQSDSAQIDQKIHETQVLMDQTHQLYQQFFTGVEKRAPIEKVRLLESKINELQRISGSSPTARFKISQFIQNYNTFKDLWDRKLRDREKSK